ncbi:MAG TPA: hypothetical protein VIN06_19820, partial [Devosia sp.]
PEATLPPPAQHEARDVSVSRLAVSIVIFVCVLALAIGVLWFVFGTPAGKFNAAQPGYPYPQPEPHELAQRSQLQSYLADQQAELAALRWVDAAHTKAKVPIEDAMALLAAKGLRLGDNPAEAHDCPPVSTASPRTAAATNCGGGQ